MQSVTLKLGVYCKITVRGGKRGITVRYDIVVLEWLESEKWKVDMAWKTDYGNYFSINEVYCNQVR